MSNCSFCGKRAEEVFRIITSDGCAICNECIGRCAEMVASEYIKIAHEVKFPQDESGEGS